jgi:hypothetical protein
VRVAHIGGPVEATQAVGFVLCQLSLNDLERPCVTSRVVLVVDDALRTDDEEDKVDEVDVAI